MSRFSAVDLAWLFCAAWWAIRCAQGVLVGRRVSDRVLVSLGWGGLVLWGLWTVSTVAMVWRGEQ